jgi:hypothetical protein
MAPGPPATGVTGAQTGPSPGPPGQVPRAGALDKGTLAVAAPAPREGPCGAATQAGGPASARAQRLRQRRPMMR